MNVKKGKVYEFEKFRVETEDKTLWCKNEKISIPIKAVEVLQLLIENRGRTVTKEELMETIWQDTFVDENNLAVMISTLRKTFGEAKNDKRFIETIPRRGYRFVHELSEPESNLVLEKQTITEITLEEEQNAAIPELQKKLKRHSLGFLILAIILIGLASFFVYSNFFGKKSDENAVVIIKPKQTLAVLPFKFIGEKNSNDEYISASITDSLTTKLGKIRELNVRATSSVSEVAQGNKPPLEIGKELKVEAILTGNWQKIGESLRINLQMINVNDGSIIWSEDLDAKFNNIFLIQDILIGKVINKLAINLNDSQKATIAKKYTTNAEAERLYLQGRFYWNERNVNSLKKSIEFYENSIKLDENYALAYVGLADSYQLLAEYKGLSTNEAYSKARINATKALEIAPDLAEAHNSLAYIQSFFDWDFGRGEASFKRAIELSPNYATAHHWYAELLNVQHKFEESWQHLQIANEIDPTSVSIQTDISYYYFIKRDYEKALLEAKKMAGNYPQFGYSYLRLYMSYAKLGNEKDAAEALGKCHIYWGEDEKLVFERIKASEIGGLKAFWQKALEQAENKQIRLKPEAIDFALGYMHVGDLDKTFYYLEKSLDERNRWFLEITYDPEWDAIRNDPRYEVLIKKAGLKF